MPTPCRACGAEPRDGARFCDACGSPIATAGQAEYKQVTVLFADVVRSMDLAAELGPERLREVMGELFTRASAIVRRYGGTVDKFTGDGIMALFGAPVALEDHAVRACRAALEIHDAVELQMRIGLNSGEVITGEIGLGPTSYTAVGEGVGMAQRMESVAPPGTVMVSDSTARLVDAVALLGEPEQVHIKGAAHPVPARRLLGMATNRRLDRAEPTFVGRQWEMAALNGVLERSLHGRGSVVGVAGPPGIGKSRLVRELTARAHECGADVFATYCESHTADIAFHAAAELLRSTCAMEGLDDAAAREQLRSRFPEADDDDLLLLADLLGVAEPDADLPAVDPDARRRRLTAVVKAATLGRPTPTVYVVEDVHWIDAVSESMLAGFLSVVPQTPTLAIVTYRPEYVGALAHLPRSQTIALEPLDDSQMLALTTELLGKDRSVADFADLITDRAAGNPFFAEEIVRDLSERDVLVGGRGCYLCVDAAGDVHVPSTLQAVIAARIDRLDPAAKRTLNAAAVIGSRFTSDMLRALEIFGGTDRLVTAELIDQAASTPPEYVFRHPLIRAVAYESQLRSDRAQLHRRVAAAIEQEDHNAALIAEHLEAAGDLSAAYEWHMRAGEWSANRDIEAAQLSWDRARHVADALPVGEPNRNPMRIAARTALCSTAFRRFHGDMTERFEELRELCLTAGDKTSLASAMAAMTVEHVLHARLREASRQASEYMTLVESIGDPTLTVGLSFAAIIAKIQTAEWADVMRWSQSTIDLADGDPAKGRLVLSSPLATALTFRAVARWATGRQGWREDFERATSMARETDPIMRSAVISYKYTLALPRGVLVADDATVSEIESALYVAEHSRDDMAVVLLRLTFAVALISGSDRRRGFDIMRELRATCVAEQFALNVVPLMEVCLAVEAAELGQTDLAIDRLREVHRELLRTGNRGSVDLAVATLVDTLLGRGTPDDIEEARQAVEQLAATLDAESSWSSRDLTLLRLRAVVARAREDPAYHDLRDQYRAMADELGFEGHIAWAAEMP